jgi:hypothetical protein
MVARGGGGELLGFEKGEGRRWRASIVPAHRSGLFGIETA